MIGFLRASFGLWRLHRALERANPGLRIGRHVDIRAPERLRLGRDVVVDAGVMLHCGGQGWSEGGHVALGDRAYLGPGSVLFGAGGIDVGADVLISPGVVITSHQHTFASLDTPIRDQPLEFGPVHVADDVWIGANAVLLPGITVGRGAVIGAGAVVTRDVPPGGVALGVPARVVRARS